MRKLFHWIAVCVGIVGLGAAETKTASGPTPRLDLPGERFEVDGRPAFVFLPVETKRTSPQPWVFYAPTLPAYPDGVERWMHERFLEAGVAVAGIDVGEAYGSPQNHKYFEGLYRELEKRGFARKAVLLGRSRGGLWVSSWAIANPNRVAGIAGIYPVFDWRSYPGIEKAAPAYQLTVEALGAKEKELNPIKRVEAIARAKIPVYLIHGDMDKVVPLEPNSGEFVSSYRKAGAEKWVELEVLEKQGHNYYEGFFRSQRLVDFVIRQALESAK